MCVSRSLGIVEMVGLEIFRLTMMCQYGIELNEEGRDHS